MGDINNSETVQITGTIMVIVIIVLFLVVVFVLFLHVYAKWFWLRVEQPPTPPRSRRRRRHASALERGLDPHLLPVVIIQGREDSLECSVCLSEIAQGESARVLPKCKHGFHVECIDMWFHSHSTCPLCRTPVSPQPTSSLSSSNDNQLFPTNVLVSEDQTRVSSGPTTSTAHHLPSSSTNALVIDVHPNLSDSFGEDNESKSPAPPRFSPLKRLLSREWDKRKAPTSSTNSADEV